MSDVLQASATSQALVGWQGRAWDVVVDFDNTALASLSIPACMTIVWLTLYRFHCSNKPSLGWVVGSGLGYRIQHPPNSESSLCPTAPVACVANYNVYRLTAVVDQASVGRLGRIWDIGHGGVGVVVI